VSKTFKKRLLRPAGTQVEISSRDYSERMTVIGTNDDGSLWDLLGAGGKRSPRTRSSEAISAYHFAMISPNRWDVPLCRLPEREKDKRSCVKRARCTEFNFQCTRRQKLSLYTRGVADKSIVGDRYMNRLTYGSTYSCKRRKDVDRDDTTGCSNKSCRSACDKSSMPFS
jgi:hypothetical protein